MSAIGGKSPNALCDLSSLLSLYSLHQCSIFSLASSSVGNQCAFRHSARNFPLNDSMDALSVGLPGREKSSGNGVELSVLLDSAAAFSLADRNCAEENGLTATGVAT